MCVTSLLCGPQADLWPFYVSFMGFYRFFPHTNPYILNVIFRAWATCVEYRSKPEKQFFHTDDVKSAQNLVRKSEV